MQTIEEPGAVAIKLWTDGVPLEATALEQLRNTARLPFIHGHIAVMPDVHFGIGATIGSVVPTIGAVVPAAVGVDLGCGMVAARTNLFASDLPESLAKMRSAIEATVPHGRTNSGGAGDRGAWSTPPAPVMAAWKALAPGFRQLCAKHPKIEKSNQLSHLGTLGGGNHFIEVCLDTAQRVWVMLHSGSRGVGGRIGSYFIELAKADMRRQDITLPDADLAYLEEGSESFSDYVEAVEWAQGFARTNRELMLQATRGAMTRTLRRPVVFQEAAVNCHHNYISREHHFGQDVIVTRKGAVSARAGELGIIPGSMGAKSFIVRGRGHAESFHSCSHGAGRAMSRNAAKKRFTVNDHETATAGVECRKDADVVDETPGAYKNIDAVMAAQADLVEVVATLKQALCVKG